MPKPFQVLTWREFGGLYDGVAAEAAPGQASVLDNMYRDREALKRRKGFTAVAAAISPAQDIDGLGWFKVFTGEYLISAHNGRLYDWLFAAELSGSSGKLTSGSLTSMAWLDNRVYIGEGVLQNIAWNGTDTFQVLTDTPTTAATVAAGAATGPTGTYTYYVTYTSHIGKHSALSPLSASVTVTNQKVSLSDIPICGAGQNCAGRGIWRNKNGTTTYYRVTTIANNTATTYTDSTLDTGLSEPLTDVLGANLQNVRFPPSRYLISHQNRLVGAFSTNAEGDKQTVYLSNYREPWYCPLVPDLHDPTQGSRFALQGPGAGEVTGLASHGNQIVVFTTDAKWLLTTSDQLLDYTLHRFSNHGCVAHRTIASVKDRLIWASSDGIYMAQEGQGVQRISDDIKVTYQAISTADMAKAFGFIWDDRYVFIWPNGCRIYDLRYGLWTRNTNWAWRCATVTSLGVAVEKIYAAQNGVARVFQLESGVDDNGTAITAKWASHDFDCGLPGRDKRLLYVNGRWKAATGTATVRVYRGTGTTATQTATKDISIVDDTGGTVSSLRQRCNDSARSEWFRIENEYAGSAADYQMLQMEVQWNPIT